MPNPVTWFEIGGRKSKKLDRFYADLFEWHVDTNNPMDYGVVDTHAGKGISGGITPTQRGRHVTIFVEVDDLQAYLDKAVKLGGKVIIPVTVVPKMAIFATFSDPAGNVIGLLSPQMPD
jgi:uncharacterized protein